MKMMAAKTDARDVVGSVVGVTVVLLVFAVVATTWSLTTALYLVVLAAGGFLVARLLGRRGLRMAVPRSFRRGRGESSFHRMAGDQPFSTRLGWTSGTEPGGALPDARKVTPYGKYGGGLMVDGFAGALIIAALLAIVFLREPAGGLLGLVLIGFWALAGFGLVAFVRWLRHR